MKGKTAKVDERQRMELLEAEHSAFWAVFYGLAILAVGQLVFFKGDWRLIAGEGAALILGCAVLAAGCLRKGLWDYVTTPSQSTYLMGAAAAALLVCLCSLLIRLARGLPVHPAFLLVLSAGVFIAAYGILALMGHMVLRRRKMLEEAADDAE